MPKCFVHIVQLSSQLNVIDLQDVHVVRLLGLFFGNISTELITFGKYS